MLSWPFNKYPGTDYETFNWEWIIGNLKELIKSVLKHDEVLGDLSKKINTIYNLDLQEYTMPSYFYTPQMFGAKGDGVTDDTQAIQDAIDHLTQLAREKRNNTWLVLLFPGGSYKITDTLIMPPVIKYKTSGTAYIKYYGSGTAIKITNNWTTEPTDDFTASEYLTGNLFDGSWVIQNMNSPDANDTTSRSGVGMEIGYNVVDAYSSINRVSTGRMEGVEIKGFSIGIKLNSIYSYFFNFTNCKIWRNNKAIELGANGIVNNGTELISFERCWLTNNDQVFVWDQTPVNVHVTLSSIDYNNNIFYAPELSNGVQAIITNSHIEGVGEGPAANPSGHKSLIAGSFRRSTVNISDTVIAFNRQPVLQTETIDPSVRINLVNIETTTGGNADSHTGADDYYVFNRRTTAINWSGVTFNNDYADGTRMIKSRVIAPNRNMINNSNFKDEDAGTISNINTGAIIGPYQVSASGNWLRGAFLSDSPLPDGRTLTLETTASNSTIALDTPVIPCTPGKWYKLNTLTYNTQSIRVIFKYFDADENILYTSNESASQPGITSDTWYTSPYAKTSCAPPGATAMQCTVKFLTNDNTNTEYIKIADIHVEEI